VLCVILSGLLKNPYRSENATINDEIIVPKLRR
jgi:hypothetical protein